VLGTAGGAADQPPDRRTRARGRAPRRGHVRGGRPHSERRTGRGRDRGASARAPAAGEQRGCRRGGQETGCRGQGVALAAGAACAVGGGPPAAGRGDADKVLATSSAAASSASDIARSRGGVSHRKPRWANQARVPVAPAPAPMAPIMHCMHTALQYGTAGRTAVRLPESLLGCARPCTCRVRAALSRASRSGGTTGRRRGGRGANRGASLVARLSARARQLTP
jgi:hypothetical protein